MKNLMPLACQDTTLDLDYFRAEPDRDLPLPLQEGALKLTAPVHVDGRIRNRHAPELSDWRPKERLLLVTVDREAGLELNNVLHRDEWRRRIATNLQHP